MALQQIDSEEAGLVVNEPTPSEKVIKAEEWSRALMTVVNKTSSSKNSMILHKIGNQYLKVEAWALIATFAGLRVETEWIKPFLVEEEIAGFEAKVVLVDLETGEKRGGGAISFCGMDEYVASGQKSLGAKRNAVMSMAQTRATSKAVRLNFSYVAVLGGYEPTPAEEMQDFDEKAKDSFSDHIIDASKNSQPSSASQNRNGGDQSYEFYCNTHRHGYNHTQGQKDVGNPPAHKIEGEKGWCREGSQ